MDCSIDTKSIMTRIYLIGVSILLVAIFANILSSRIGVSTWYTFGSDVISRGFIAMKDISIFSFLWLFILYPITLGCGYLLGDMVYNIFD